MKKNEAIEILTDQRKEHHSFPTDVIGQAEQLGIEALDRVIYLELYPDDRVWLPLPSETTD